MNITVIVKCKGEDRLNLLKTISGLGFSADYNATDVRIHGREKSIFDLDELEKALANYPDRELFLGNDPA
jgi:hypothetical protein